MSEIIIKNDSSRPDESALFAVMKVMNMGKISTDKKGPCYCFVTRMKSGLVVCAMRNKASFGFIVSDDV